MTPKRAGEGVIEAVAKAIAEAARDANPEDCSEVCARAAMAETLRAFKSHLRSRDYADPDSEVDTFADSLSISLSPQEKEGK